MISDSTVQLYFYDIRNIDLRIWDSRIEFHRTGTAAAAAACWQSLTDCTVGKILLFTDSTVQSDSTVQLYNYEYSKIPGYQDIDTGTASRYMKITPRGKSGQHGLLFPRPARCRPYA
jgi:hypothetical protein